MESVCTLTGTVGSNPTLSAIKNKKLKNIYFKVILVLFIFDMKKDITIIITLYKTPIKKLKALNQYKNFKVIIFAQEADKNYQNMIKKKFFN